MAIFLRNIIALAWILHTLRSSAVVGDGIEKVSYLLQYGPGVHTVFEAEANSSDKPAVTTGSSSSTLLHQPRSTTTMRYDLNTATVGAVGVASSAPQGPADEAHRLESGEGPNVTKGRTDPTTTARTVVGLINTAATSIVPSAATYLSSSSDPPKGNREDAIGAGGATRPSSSSTANRIPTLLPPTPVLPNFGSMLHPDVMVNLKPRELRTLMTTYITLIETYKSFNQQQKRNIARLTKELQSLEKDRRGVRSGTE